MHFEKKLTNNNLSNVIQNKSFQVALLADEICPRYHFAGLENVFFERPPYLNRKKFYSRLITLGKLDSKEKYLKAFNLVPFAEIIDIKEL